MNRRGFFGLLAAVALLPKRAVGQLKYTSYTLTGGACRAGRMIPRIVEEDIFGRTRILEQRWESDVFFARFPVSFRDASSSVRTTIALPKGRYRHIFRWTESTVKVGEIKSSPGLLWSITDEGLNE